MQGSDDIYLGKAEKSLAGAESEFANARYDNSVSRSYYSCFQAAIHALLLSGVRPRGPHDQWSHDFVQAQFVGLLINRRKLYPADLRQALFRTSASAMRPTTAARWSRSLKHRGPCGDRANLSTPSCEGM